MFNDVEYFQDPCSLWYAQGSEQDEPASRSLS